MTSEDNNRRYVPAVFDPNHAPGTSPKLAGGVEVSRQGNTEAPRGMNRADQRYELPLSVLTQRRHDAALAELEQTIVLQHTMGTYQVIAKSFNRYTVASDLSGDDCPDTLRLAESSEPGQSGTPQTYAERGAVCKHTRIVQILLSDPPPAGLDWSTAKMAEHINALASTTDDPVDVSEQTIRHLCEQGRIPATRRKRVWCIHAATAQAAADDYASTIVGVTLGG